MLKVKLTHVNWFSLCEPDDIGHKKNPAIAGLTFLNQQALKSAAGFLGTVSQEYLLNSLVPNAFGN
jgi:hypothetical protein